MQSVLLANPKRGVTTSAYQGISARSTKQSAGWLWQEKAALRVIASAYTGKSLMAARSVYLALTEAASNQFTPDRAHTSCAYLGSLAGMGENAVRHYLHDFAALGIVAVEQHAHQANTYILLAIQPDNLAEGDVTLADGGGQSRGIGSDTPSDAMNTPTPIARSTPTRRGGIAADTQYIRIQNQEINNNNQQTGLGVVSDGDCYADVHNHRAPNTKTDMPDSAPNNQQTGQPAQLTGEGERVASDLNALGVRRNVAEDTVIRYGVVTVQAWLDYVSANTDSVKRPAGFILAQLRAGAMPPEASSPRKTSHPPQLTPSKYTDPNGIYYRLFHRQPDGEGV